MRRTKPQGFPSLLLHSLHTLPYYPCYAERTRPIVSGRGPVSWLVMAHSITVPVPAINQSHGQPWTDTPAGAPGRTAFGTQKFFIVFLLKTNNLRCGIPLARGSSNRPCLAARVGLPRRLPLSENMGIWHHRATEGTGTEKKRPSGIDGRCDS
ncbi:hypothetical protein BGZ61DRAFT_187018 [Ilyonectria robusta]|uniref:uncharacterized protein n=1 Tax=Ilyonectria robusta TaxID=1079257 RepID=UPI001E8DC76E|nr:uncharacterized protein BGZ61DRAFT_187018 [Ilyonectria robusta]KAH8729750.1 hypothetical protein BGZ61DRAFT_187018 [Ilyonectria robusta]